MKEACKNLQNAEVEPREKLKVTKADIVVALPLGEPYFNIHYREVGNDYDYIGFGSYDLNNVIRWREEEMEIVSGVEAELGNDVCEWKNEKGMFIQNPHTGRKFSNEPSMKNVYCNTCGKKIKVVE